MKNEITLDLIKQFSKNYNSNSINKIIENSITENGILKSCISKNIVNENQPVFNLELPENKRYDQKDNYKCWIYAGLNLIEYDMSKELNINLADFELSNSYIAFFDKLEKSNNAYENIINLNNVSWENIEKEKFLYNCVNEGGYFSYFVAIVNKYGLMPYRYMPDVYESLKANNITDLYMDKVKKDCVKLIKEKNRGSSIEELQTLKKKYLEENYTFLSKVLGEPVYKFDYEYEDKEGNYIIYKDMTPLIFKEKFLKINLNDFVCIGNLPMYNKEYYKKYREKYAGNVYQKSYVEFLNLPIVEIKDLVIKKLKENIPVNIRANLTKFRDISSGVLDTRLYNFQESFGFDRLTKEEALNTHDIYPHHYMSICGVNLLEKEIPQRWKVEDSYGTDEKFNGYYIMNDNYFDEFVLEAIINKKYLSDKQKKMLEEKPIEFNIGDPF